MTQTTKITIDELEQVFKPGAVVRLEQGTTEWLSWRRKKCTASRAPAIMGRAPSWAAVKDWTDLRLEMAGLSEPPNEWAQRAMDHGTRMEETARDPFAPDTLPICLEIPGVDDYAASMDGVGVDKDGELFFVEIKCPTKGQRSTLLRAVKDVKPGQMVKAIPPYVWYQMVHQAGVLDAARIDIATPGYGLLVVFAGKEADLVGGETAPFTDEDYQVVKVPFSMLMKDWNDTLKPRWDDFLAGKNEDRGKLPADIYDLAVAFKTAKKAADKAAASEKEARTALLNAIPDDVEKVEEAGVVVSTAHTKEKTVETVDYKGIVEEALPDWQDHVEDAKRYVTTKTTAASKSRRVTVKKD